MIWENFLKLTPHTPLLVAAPNAEKVRKTLKNGEFIIVDKLTQGRSSKSSGLYSTMKMYGKKDDVGLEIQFKPLDTVMHEAADVVGHDWYETTRWLKFLLEIFPVTVFPEIHLAVDAVMAEREIVRREYEEKFIDQ